MKKYILLAAAIIAALCVVFYINLDYNYTQQGEEIDIFEQCYAGASGYEVSDVGAAKHFEVSGDDPQLYIALENETALSGKSIGGVELVFDNTTQMPNSELPIQLFYVKENKDYSEKNSVKTKLKAGASSVIIPVPLDNYSMFRIDIDGNITISEVSISTGKTLSSPYISDETTKRCLWYFPAVIIGFCLIFWAHGAKRRELSLSAGGYAGYVLFGSKPKKDRAVYFDYMRVLAAVLVILAHACSPMVELADAGWKRFVLVCGLSLGLCCNLIYVMLSGALLLNADADRETVGSFYVKRASRVIIPLVAYYLLLLSLNHEVSFLPPKNIAASLKRVVTGAPDVGPHLWLIYTIIALYFVTPFFRVMAQKLSDRQLSSLAAVIIVLNMLTTYLPLFGMTFGAASFLAGWEGVFLIGYILTRWDKKGISGRLEAAIMSAAVISYAIMVVVVFVDTSKMNYVYNSAPTMVLTSCGIFLLFLKSKNWFADKSNRAVRLLSKYSYSIILIHWYALFVVVQGKLHVTALRFGCIGGIAATVVLTLAVCLIMAIIFDNTVVIVCSAIFDKLVKILTAHSKSNA